MTMSRTGARAFRGAFGTSRLEVGKRFAVQYPTARHASSSSSRGARLGSGRSLQKGTVSPKATVPAHIALPPYAVDGTIDPPTPSIFDLRGDELVKMRAACAFTRDTLKFAGSLVRHGVTTDEIDAKVFQHVTSNGGYPSPLGYSGFTKSIATSLNEVVCHGIPDDRPLQTGDIVNIDVSCFVDGFHGDTSRTFLVGENGAIDYRDPGFELSAHPAVNPEAVRLLRVSEQCLTDSIAACGPGVPLAKIGDIVTDICDRHGYEVNRTFVGHGIGATFHMLPYLIPYRNNFDQGVMQPGHVFTIEPAVCQGSQEHEVWADGWTAVTKDGGLSAQFEHTLLITTDGVEILT